MSFGFIATNEEVKNLSPHKIRYIKDMELKEISILDVEVEPAYRNTKVNTKNKGGVIDDTRNNSVNGTNNNDYNSTIFSEIDLLQKEIDLFLYSIKNELDYIK